jgi:hypothetical protein
MGSAAHPDADIYPRATGPAANIVAAHQKDEPIVLYSGWFCPFVQRSWITLEEKKIPYKYVEINPYNKEERYVCRQVCLLALACDIRQKGCLTALWSVAPEGGLVSSARREAGLHWLPDCMPVNADPHE